MKSLAQVKKLLQKHRASMDSDYGVTEIGVFGSYVRGQQKPGSDLDILVEFRETPDMFELVRLEQSLANSLGLKVDLVRKGGIRPELKNTILSEAVMI